MHYAIVYKNMAIEDFDAPDDESAELYAKARYSKYDDLVCVREGRSLGGWNIG